MSLVFHVRSWRKRLGWSRKTAAEKLGISVHTVKSYELCRRDLPTPVCKLMMRLEEEERITENSSTETVVIGGGFMAPSSDAPLGPSLVYPCFGQTARTLLSLYQAHEKPAAFVGSKMATNDSPHETVHDLQVILADLCQKSDVKCIHLACTYLDFKAAEFIKNLRKDVTVISYFSSFISKTKDADYFFNIEDRLGSVFYSVTSKEGQLIIEGTDKEVVLANLLECLDQMNCSDYPKDDFDEHLNKNLVRKNLVNEEELSKNTDRLAVNHKANFSPTPRDHQFH